MAKGNLSGSDNPRKNPHRFGPQTPQEKYMASLSPEERQRHEQRREKRKADNEAAAKEKQNNFYKAILKGDRKTRVKELSRVSVENLTMLLSGITSILYKRLAGKNAVNEPDIPEELVMLEAAATSEQLYEIQLIIPIVILAEYKNVCGDYNNMLRHS
jgi:transcriptional regulator of acetoin/glycerol metabolism